MDINQIIINGTTPFSIVIKKIIEQECMCGGKVLCFSTLRKFVDCEFLEGIPVIAIEDIPNLYDVSKIGVVNTIGYTQQNRLREKANYELQQLGLRVIS